MDALSRAREFFKKDHFATDMMGVVIDEVEEGRSVCSVVLDKRHLNADGQVMGGVLFTLADFAFAVAANLDQPLTVTLSSHIAFLSPARGKRLVATATRVRQGHTTCVYQVDIDDEATGTVAAVSITGFIKR